MQNYEIKVYYQMEWLKIASVCESKLVFEQDLCLLDQKLASEIFYNRLTAHYEMSSSLNGPNNNLMEFFLLNHKKIFRCDIWLIVIHSFKNKDTKITAYGAGNMNRISQTILETMIYDSLKTTNITMSQDAVNNIKNKKYSLFNKN